MNKKGGNVIRIVLGVYLIYLVYLSLSERSMHFLRQKKCLLR